MKRIDVIDNFRDFVNELFDMAIEQRASDIHIEPQKGDVEIRFRIDWELKHIFELDNQNRDNLATRIKIMSQMKIDENRLPQDGNIVYIYKEKEDVDMRVSTFPTLYWEKVVLRLLRKNSSLLNIGSLWFTAMNLKVIKRSLELKEWLILVAWPTWSWKTTTLYSMLNHYNPKEHNISTLEDPVEYKLPWVNQSQVKPEINYTFANGLRTLLRQDPDIILVWEIRDKETAMLAVEASLTWHLVFGTIHATKWVWVIERLVNMWVEQYLIASALKLIVAQRLVKKFCACSQNVDMWDIELWHIKEWLWSIYDSVKENAVFKKRIWCNKCFNTWYLWRIWLYEVVMIDSEISKLIAEWVEEKKWDELTSMKWFLSLYQDWLLKILFGMTEISQVLPYK